MTEKEKYEKLAQIGYFNVGPCNSYKESIAILINQNKVKNFIDFGCGRGLLVEYIKKNTNANSYGVDIQLKAITSPSNIYYESEIKDFTSNIKYEVCTCFDVLEHIQEQNIIESLKAIRNVCSGLFVATISLIPDIQGKKINEILHICLKPKEWWLKQIIEAGFIIIYKENNLSQLFVMCE